MGEGRAIKQLKRGGAKMSFGTKQFPKTKMPMVKMPKKAPMVTMKMGM